MSQLQVTKEGSSVRVDCGNEDTQTIRQCSKSQFGGVLTLAISIRLYFRQMPRRYLFWFLILST
jgi:hypothetical protein